MVDSTKDIVKHVIVAPYLSGLDQYPTKESLVKPTITAMQELHKTVLTDYFLYLSRVKNPLE
jgi:hypothetical protein